MKPLSGERQRSLETLVVLLLTGKHWLSNVLCFLCLCLFVQQGHTYLYGQYQSLRNAEVLVPGSVCISSVHPCLVPGYK